MEISTTARTPVYRMARLGDLDDIAKIETATFGDQSYPYFVLRQLFDVHGSSWLVAELDGVVLGYVLVALTAARRAWLVGFAVSVESHGHGYGRTLLQRALALCRTLPVDSVYITVRPTNQSAYNLYKRAGFTWSGYEESYFGAGEPRDVLVHKLDH